MCHKTAPQHTSINWVIYVKQQNKVLTGGALDLCGKQWELWFQHDQIITKAEIIIPKS